MLRRLSTGYFGGAIGAIVNSLAVWLAARADVLERMGVAIDPELTWAWLSPRILWGGIWGLGLPLVMRQGLAPVRAGLVLSLAPSAVQLFYLLPSRGHAMLGVELGPLTPIVVLVANAIWGWTLGRVAIRLGNGGGGGAKRE